MGNYLNKLIPNSSTASGSGDDGPSGIVKALTALVTLMLVSSVFAGGALAHSANDVRADDITVSAAGEEVTTSIYLDGATINSSETVSVNITASDVSFENLQDAGLMDNTSVVSGDVSVSGFSQNGDTITIELTANSDINSESVVVELQSLVVNSDGTGTVAYTPTGGSEMTGSFSYSIGSSEPATGTAALGNFSTYDNESVDSVDVRINNASGDLAVDESNVTDFENYSEELETGDYTYTLVADGYADAEGSFTVSENNTTELNPKFGAMQLDYDFTVENNSSAVDEFDFAIYEGDSIGDNDTALVSTTVGENDSNTVTVQNLDDGSDYTVEIVYNDSDGNETTYTETITANSSDAENGTVSQTVDVAGDESDDGSFIPSVPSFDNPFDGVFDGIMDELPTDDTDALIVTFVGGFVLVIGSLFAIVWTLRGLRLNF